jgi:hypothetical protein
MGEEPMTISISAFLSRQEKNPPIMAETPPDPASLPVA